ncbi:hypothetical protein FHW69_001059 [Luteibacter sp. Sphag1AF]|uniref:surface lipoprotein assembly modifier n=1 Tax=Luteibacter sp. Sphag1AF TaxID=2587031 RepID=UPI00160E6D32|nr:surface lipoprotein assembly modifier [Luteibacter sp. Sphag1AF]MBB3226469.1 hypothetical protein [Luteibacter sp. Sphag1AF]
MVTVRHPRHHGQGPACRLLFSLVLVWAATGAHAQSAQDTRLRLDQGIELKAADDEKDRVKDADASGPDALVIDGTRYEVAHNVSDVGEALYVSIVRRQWPDVRRFFAMYEAMPERDPMLVLYARGALAREDGKLDDAEKNFRDLLDLQSDFLPGQLELARVLFENQSDREALALFRRIEASLDSHDPKTTGVRKSVATFIAALERRRAWQGSFALGPGFNDNLNQTSASETCLLAMDGLCFINRTIPGPESARGLDYEATLNRRIPLAGHGGVYLRSVAYGDVYDSKTQYNQSTITTQMGYDVRTARGSYAVAPTFDTGTFGTGILYTAWGLHGEWIRNLSPQTMVRLEGDVRQMRYRQRAYHDFTGRFSDVFATVWHALPGQWTVFGGVDYIDKQARDDTNAYTQRGLRLGVTRPLGPGFNAYLSTSLRSRNYGAWSELLEARRRDHERNVILILGMPKFAFAGLTPSLSLQWNHVRSNVDWLYSYDRRVVNFKLEHQF